MVLYAIASECWCTVLYTDSPLLLPLATSLVKLHWPFKFQTFNTCLANLLSCCCRQTAVSLMLNTVHTYHVCTCLYYAVIGVEMAVVLYLMSDMHVRCT